MLNIAVSNSLRLTTLSHRTLGFGTSSDRGYATSSFDSNCFGSMDALLRSRLIGLSVKAATTKLVDSHHDRDAVWDRRKGVNNVV